MLTLVATLGTFSMHLFVPALPSAAQDLAVSEPAIQQVVSIYLWGLALGQILSGPLVDRLGERKMLLLGLGVYALGAAAGALAHTLDFLLAGRLVQALGACACLVVARSAVSRGRQAAEAIADLSVITLGITMSSTSAPLIGVGMLAVLDWRTVLAILAALGLAIGVRAFFAMSDESATKNIERQSIAETPRDFSKILRSAQFLVCTLVGSTATVGIYAFYTALPFLFQEEFPQHSQSLGLIYLCIAAGSVGGAVMSRLYSRSLPIFTILWLGAFGSFAGAAGFLVSRAIFPESLVAMTLPLTMMTAAGGFIAPGSLALATFEFRERSGVATSLYGTLQMVVGAFSSLAVSFVGHGSARVGMMLLTLTAIGLASLAVLTRTKPNSSS